MLDYHVHTTQSVDCDTPILDSCAAAVAARVTEIAFTDHIEHEPADLSYGFFDCDQYMRDLAEARARYDGQLVILSGAEVDFNTRISPAVERFLDSHEFDFVIGSIHYGEAGEIIFPSYFSTRSYDAVFRAYLEQIHAAVETGWFDTIGHIDLPKRYAPRCSGAYAPLDYVDELRAIFRTMIDQGISFEINTSGLRQPPKSSMPSAQVVALYVQEGGRLITMGSDSHVPSTIGAGFERTFAMLELCGIHEISSFRARQRRQVPIADLVRTREVS